jgi:hypothetical protein
MNLMKSVVLTLVVGGFGFAAAVQGQTKGEKVELKTLPSPVQKTINEKAAGGKIVSVMREDDSDGKWNYEVAVNSNGKQWQFEVSPSGKATNKKQ